MRALVSFKNVALVNSKITAIRVALTVENCVAIEEAAVRTRQPTVHHEVGGTLGASDVNVRHFWPGTGVTCGAGFPHAGVYHLRLFFL